MNTPVVLTEENLADVKRVLSYSWENEAEWYSEAIKYEEAGQVWWNTATDEEKEAWWATFVQAAAKDTDPNQAFPSMARLALACGFTNKDLV